MAETVIDPDACVSCGAPNAAHLRERGDGQRPDGPFCADCITARIVDATEKTIGDELREAAVRLREMAKDAPPGPWGVNGPWWWDRGDQPADATSCVVTEHNQPVAVLAPPYNRHADAELAGPWIALVSPELAEPLASWLERVAEEFGREVIEDSPECPNCGEGCAGHPDALVHDDGCGNWLADADAPGLRCECFDPALAVARVLNGTTS